MSEPIITKRMKTVRNKEASPSPRPPLMPALLPQQGSSQYTGTLGKKVSDPSLGPETSVPLLSTERTQLCPSISSLIHLFTNVYQGGHGNPLQYPCLENPLG